MAHVEALSVAHAVFFVSPFAGGGRREIVRRPKVYGFDTGFVTFVKGWDSIREDDRGLLWEHLVLDELRARVDERTPDSFDPEALRAFRAQYPKGQNFVTGPWVDVPYVRRYGDLAVTFGTPADLLSPAQSPRSHQHSRSPRTRRTAKRS